jgi:hypothetical protein
MADKPDFSDADFHSSDHCAAAACVEVAQKGGFVAVRHSGSGDDPIVFTESEWSAFTQGVKDGQFDV